tara:strand:+ start:40 stop:1005 length:966 start_codon:yes stop_codon:yes gene_type:complete
MSLNYNDSGVHIQNGNDLVNVIKDITGNNSIGGFANIYEHNGMKLVASTDGVGTKLLLCKETKQYKTIGIDLVAMCVNDILCCGGKPLFFLDYYAVEKLNLDIAKDIIEGIQKGCSLSNCLLIGGETAELPSIYRNTSSNQNNFDLAGFCVGFIDGDVYPRNIKEGDLICGLSSNGVHSNGFSLIHRLLKENEYDLDELMKPTKIYLDDIQRLKDKYLEKVKGFAHITGGGLIDNIPRILDDDLTMNINQGWKIPDVFKWIYECSDMTKEEMLKTYNCGIGMIIILDKSCPIPENSDLLYLGEIIKDSMMKIDYDKILFKA